MGTQNLPTRSSCPREPAVREKRFAADRTDAFFTARSKRPTRKRPGAAGPGALSTLRPIGGADGPQRVPPDQISPASRGSTIPHSLIL